jgi:hypothetical protein
MTHVVSGSVARVVVRVNCEDERPEREESKLCSSRWLA